MERLLNFTKQLKSFTKQKWVDKVNEFYNRFIQPWIKDKNFEIDPTPNEKKSVVE